MDDIINYIEISIDEKLKKNLKTLIFNFIVFSLLSIFVCVILWYFMGKYSILFIIPFLAISYALFRIAISFRSILKNFTSVGLSNGIFYIAKYIGAFFAIVVIVSIIFLMFYIILKNIFLPIQIFSS